MLLALLCAHELFVRVLNLHATDPCLHEASLFSRFFAFSLSLRNVVWAGNARAISLQTPAQRAHVRKAVREALTQ